MKASTPIRKKQSSAKPKRITVTKAKKKADEAFSLFIRTRDSVKGVCTCATCGAKHPIKAMHAGHFISRKHMATRYDERNVNAQCFACNIHNKGEQYKHSLYVDTKYGQGTAQILHELSQTIVQMKAQDYLDIVETYKKKTEVLTSG